MTLRLTELTATDLENIQDYIALENPEAALTTIEDLFAVMQRLTEYPKLGRAAEFGTRKVIHSPFVIVYRIVEEVISIEAVLHGRRRYD